MKKELTQLLTERATLLRLQNIFRDASETGDADDMIYLLEAPADNTAEETDTESDSESIMVDFDFDIKNQKYFDTFMTIRYYWNDWTALYTEIH